MSHDDKSSRMYRQCPCCSMVPEDGEPHMGGCVVGALEDQLAARSAIAPTDREHGFDKWWDQTGCHILCNTTAMKAARAAWVTGRTYGVDGGVSDGGTNG